MKTRVLELRLIDFLRTHKLKQDLPKKSFEKWCTDYLPRYLDRNFSKRSLSTFSDIVLIPLWRAECMVSGAEQLAKPLCMSPMSLCCNLMLYRVMCAVIENTLAYPV